jgi:hypothetical protein
VTQKLDFGSNPKIAAIDYGNRNTGYVSIEDESSHITSMICGLGSKWQSNQKNQHQQGSKQGFS